MNWKIFTVILLTLILFTEVGNAQDTTFIQTLDFSDITKRRDTYTFPSGTDTYRKILMYYTLKCDPQTGQDQFNCGEWDYLTYNFIYDHTGVMDSDRVEHPFFLAGLNSPDTFNYSVDPMYDLYQRNEYHIVYDTIKSETTHKSGTGLISSNIPFGASNPMTKAQYLWTAAELSAAGLTAGNIDKLGFDITQMGSGLRGLTVRMWHTTGNSLQTFETATGPENYKRNTDFSSIPSNNLELTLPFNWNGTDNIVVEMIYTNLNAGSDNPVDSDTTSNNSCAYVNHEDGYFSYSNKNYLNVPLNHYDFGDEITISFWSYGDPAIQPSNGSLFAGTDSTGDRSLNTHLPWGNSRVYWDAGEGSGYDRIDKAASSLDFEGKWSHWTFTKNSLQGTMRIYLNGNLWLGGSAKNRKVGKIKEFVIGKALTYNGKYEGSVDEFRIWDKELSQTDIQQWMYKDLDNSHPDWNDLVVYYKFDEKYGPVDHSGNNYHPSLIGSPVYSSYNNEAFRNVTVNNLRPNVTFTQGDYVTSNDTVTVVDSILRNPISIVEFAAIDRIFVPINTTFGYGGTHSYTYDVSGNKIDSVFHSTDQQKINHTIHLYKEPYEIVDRYEIARYITPYGIGLDLGPEGFTWVFDVTDYAHLLKGQVDLSAGNQQELIDLKFAMIKGTPPRDVVKMNRPWGRSRSHSYKNLDDDVSLPAVKIPVEANTDSYKMTTRFTGHGHHSNTGSYPHCCEWKNNTHYLHVNGSQVADWHIWLANDCALNPVFPQGGTWLGAREGWCPGDIVKDYEFEIGDNVIGDTVEVDYSITPVPLSNLGMGSGNYIVAMHLFQYGSANHSIDAEVYNVKSPNNWEYYSRINPICFEPVIVVRNAGSTALTSLKITYGVSGGNEKTYDWSGNLDYMEKETITLPIDDESFWIGDSQDKFTVSLSEPNGGADEYADNDSYTTDFQLPDIYNEDFILQFRTNNKAYENSYTIKDVNGAVIMSRNNLNNNTTYSDTVKLERGCYTFEFLDTGNDGLSYWANTSQGNGFLRFNKLPIGFLKFFEAEFGRSINYSFIVGGLTNVDPIEVDDLVQVYPNPTEGHFQLEMMGLEGSYKLEILDITGAVILKKNISVGYHFSGQLDISEYPDGVYFVNISNKENTITRKIVKF